MEKNKRLFDFLSKNSFSQDADGIYISPVFSASGDQENEKLLRESVAQQQYKNYLGAISRSHSISVMDYEVDRFLKLMPKGAIILDIGGCWGWHWRRLAETRPDIGVLIIDFIHSNLHHAKNILGTLLGTQVALMHADATALPFPDVSRNVNNGFDGIWSVQVFQHIPNYTLACKEVYRTLNWGGQFINYSLHITPFNRFLFNLFKKEYHLEGTLENRFYLSRANDAQKITVESIFGNVQERYTECLFHPDLKLFFAGKFGSWVGRFDSRLSDMPWISRMIGRQRSFQSAKIL